MGTLVIHNVIVDNTVKNTLHQEVSTLLYIVAVIVFGLIVKLFHIIYYNKQIKKKYIARSRDTL